MEAAYRKEVSLRGSGKKSHVAESEKETKRISDGVNWYAVLRENPDFFGEESGCRNYLDIPTFMRRGITITVMGADS